MANSIWDIYWVIRLVLRVCVGVSRGLVRLKLERTYTHYHLTFPINNSPIIFIILFFDKKEKNPVLIPDREGTNRKRNMMKIGIWINSRLYFWSDFSSAPTTRPNGNRWRWIYSNIIHMVQFFSIAEQFDSFWVSNFGLGPILSGLMEQIIPIEISMLKKFFTSRSCIWIHLKTRLNCILVMKLFVWSMCHRLWRF